MPKSRESPLYSIFRNGLPRQLAKPRPLAVVLPLQPLAAPPCQVERASRPFAPSSSRQATLTHLRRELRLSMAAAEMAVLLRPRHPDRLRSSRNPGKRTPNLIQLKFKKLNFETQPPSVGKRNPFRFREKELRNVNDLLTAFTFFASGLRTFDIISTLHVGQVTRWHGKKDLRNGMEQTKR